MRINYFFFQEFIFIAIGRAEERVFTKQFLVRNISYAYQLFFLSGVHLYS